MKRRFGPIAFSGLLFLLLVTFVIPLLVNSTHIVGDTSWRISGIHQLDPDLGFFNIPGSRSSWTDQNGNHEEAQINSQGLRGPEVSTLKPNSRVVLIGDSMVFGHGLRDSETISAQLNELLTTSSKKKSKAIEKAEVINGGVNGYGLDQEFKLLNRLLTSGIKPDHLVWFLYYNDFLDVNTSEINLFSYDKSSEQVIDLDVKSSFFYRSSMFYLKLRKSLPDGLTEGFIKPFWLLSNSLASRLTARVSRGVAMNFKLRSFTKTVSDLAKNQRFKVAVIVLPDRNHKRDLSYLKEFSEIPLIDLNYDERFKSQWDSLFLVNDERLSAQGTKKVAEVLRDWIKSK